MASSVMTLAIDPDKKNSKVDCVCEMVKADAMHAIAELWHSTMLAVVGWSLTAPVFVLCFYFLMTPLLRRLARRSSSRSATLKGVSSAP